MGLHQLRFSSVFPLYKKHPWHTWAAHTQITTDICNWTISALNLHYEVMKWIPFKTT